MKKLLILTSLVCFIMVLPIISGMDFRDSLWTYYTLNESSGNTAEMLPSGIYNLTNMSTSNWREGLIGNGYYVNDSMSVAEKQTGFSVQDTSINFSFNIWINRTYSTDPIDTGVILANTDGSMDQEGEIRISTGTSGTEKGRIKIQSYVGGTIETLFGKNITEDINEWKMHTFLFNDTGIKYYYDGQLYNQTSFVTTITEFTNNFSLFNDNTNSLESFNTSYDEISFWNRTISQSEINQLYSFGNGISYTPLPFNTLDLDYNNETSSGGLETFSINLTYDSSSYTGITTYLTYNNTNYSTSSTGTGDNKQFQTSISVPGTDTETNKSFYFDIGLTNSSGTFWYQSTTNNQSISPINLSNCSLTDIKLFNLTMLDEESLSEINGTIEYYLNLYSIGTTNLITSYNNSITYEIGDTPQICISNLNSTYKLEYTIKYYGNSSYYDKYKIIQNLTINNETTTQLLDLYNLLQASGNTFKVILVGSTIGNKGLLIDAQKEYVSQNQFISVENSESDNSGEGVLHLITGSEVYNFLVTYQNKLLGTFNNYKVQCQNPSTQQCTITLNLAQATGQIPDFETYGNISLYYSLDNSTNILSLTYSSTDGEVKYITQNVIKNDGYGNTTICYQETSGTSGTLTCSIPTQYQNYSIFSEVYVNGEYVKSNFFSLGQSLKDFETYGVEIFIQLMLFSTLVLLFISHPIFIVGGAILGTLLSILLLFLTGGSFGAIMSVFGYYLVAGLIVIYIISKKLKNG